MSKKKNPGLKKVFELLFRHGGEVVFYGHNTELSKFSVNIKRGKLNGNYKFLKKVFSNTRKYYILSMDCSDPKKFESKIKDIGLVSLGAPDFTKEMIDNYIRLNKENVQDNETTMFLLVLGFKIAELFETLKNGKTKYIYIAGLKIPLKSLKKRKVEYTIKICPAEKTEISIKHSPLSKKDTFTIDLFGKSLEDISHKLIDKVPLS